MRRLPVRRSTAARTSSTTVLKPVVVALGEAADGHHGTTPSGDRRNPHEHPPAPDHQRGDQPGECEQRRDEGDELARVVADRQTGEPLDAVEGDAAPAAGQVVGLARARARSRSGLRPCRCVTWVILAVSSEVDRLRATTREQVTLEERSAPAPGSWRRGRPSSARVSLSITAVGRKSPEKPSCSGWAPVTLTAPTDV